MKRTSVVYGVREIATSLGLKPRQAQGLVERGHLPVFREGRVVCSTRSALDEWIATREQEMRKVVR